MRDIKKEILNVIFKYVQEDRCAVFLFGSLAQGKIYPSSDIDIGIVSEKPLENATLVKIKEGLKKVKTLRDIDIVDFTPSRDRDFLKTALKGVKIWHQTKKSGAYLSGLKRLIKD